MFLQVAKRTAAKSNWVALQADGLLYLAALLLALAASKSVGATLPSNWASSLDLLLLASFSLSLISVNSAIGLYRRDSARRDGVWIRAAAAAAIGTTILYIAVRALAPPLSWHINTPFALLPYAFVVASLRPLLYAMRNAGIGLRRILILGNSADALAVQERLSNSWNQIFEIVGVLPVGEQTADCLGALRVFDRDTNLWKLVSEMKVNEVIVAAREQRGGVLPLRDLLECRIRGVNILDQTAFFERVHGEFPIESLKASWLIYGRGFEQGLGRRIAKRSTDLIVSSVLLLLALPVMLLAAIAIRLEGRGPVIYRQERVGQGGRTFQVLKFRSMRSDAERDGVAQWAHANDPRITRVGRVIRKTRIDELPQLVNVLRGEMSIVGPRPERPAFVDRLKRELRFYDVRHSIKPGLTGWAQVRFNYAASLEDSQRKLQFDLYYVKNHTLGLDVRILFETVRVVLRGEGAR